MHRPIIDADCILGSKRFAQMTDKVQEMERDTMWEEYTEKEIARLKALMKMQSSQVSSFPIFSRVLNCCS